MTVSGTLASFQSWADAQRNRGGNGSSSSASSMLTNSEIQSRGVNAIQSGVNAAQSGVNAILNAGGQIKSDANSMRGQAKLVNTQGDALNTTAGQIKGLANDLTPYADDLSDKGDALWGEGSALYDEAKDVFGQGKALVSLDPTATGLAGEFVKQYGYLSPDRYVSRAASDTQSSYDNAQSQSERALARRGVSLSSGAAQSLMKTYKQNLAAALAGAKTRARQTGIDEQTKMLSTMTNAANTLYNMGNETAQTAGTLQNAGVNAKDKAAGVISSAGDLLGKAGNLEQAAGQLYSNAASIFGDAGALELNYAKTAQSAYADLASAQQAAASYYQGEAKLSNAGGGHRVSTSSSSSSDYDPWEATGHTSTYWKNNLSNEAFTAMANDMANLAAGVAAS